MAEKKSPTVDKAPDPEKVPQKEYASVSTPDLSGWEEGKPAPQHLYQLPNGALVFFSPPSGKFVLAKHEPIPAWIAKQLQGGNDV